MQYPTEANDKLHLDQIHFVFSYLRFLCCIFSLTSSSRASCVQRKNNVTKATVWVRETYCITFSSSPHENPLLSSN